MEIPRMTEAGKARFLALLPDDPRVTTRPMFANIGAYVDGNMFMGVFGEHVGVKLGKADVAELLALPGGGPFGPADRPMGGYANVPAELPEAAARAWVAKALAHVGALPPKQPAAKKPKGS